MIMPSRARAGRIAALAALLVGTALVAPGRAAESPAAPSISLESGFANPPNSARPRVWWHWMNGNITKDGIHKDLDWMSRVGIGGLQNFDASLLTPTVVPHRLVYMSADWKDAFRFAASEADRYGLELAIASSPGWSETGGPWVKPEDAMKKLVWSETVVAGGRPFDGVLAAPPHATGPFADAPEGSDILGNLPSSKPVFYADAAVIAYPLDGPAPATPRMSIVGGGPLDAAVLTDQRLTTGVSVPRAAAEAPGAVLIEYPTPQTVRGLSLAVEPGARASLTPRLEADDGAGGWRTIAEVELAGAPQTTISFAPVTAGRFRVTFAPQRRPPEDMLAIAGTAPGAVKVSLAPPPPRPTFALAELRLSTEPVVNRFEQKAGYAIASDYYALDAAAPPSQGVAPGSVIDLTGQMAPDGRLTWTPPPGRWKVLRLGYSLVGATNHPATAEATGLEVDKFDAAAVRRYLETYLAMYADATGPDLIGAHGLRAFLTDSTEVGPSNWTAAMLADFQTLRGYDPRPWLPALTGVVVGTQAQSDAFLYDFRHTLADLMASEHYGTVAAVAHEHGLTLYGEALEDRRPVLGDDLTLRSHTDIPMAALWSYRSPQGPRLTLLGDMKGAASVAHIYGQNLVAAESMTSALSPWAFAPSDLKRFIDDVAYFAGEEGPLTELYATGALKSLPTRYAFDFVDADIVLGRLSVDDHDLTAPSGARYRALYLGGTSRRMTLPVLRKLADFAEAGATIIGPAPASSPSLDDDPIAFADLVKRLWGGGAVTRIGRGQVIASADLEPALQGLGLAPDLGFDPDQGRREILFVHRRLADGDAYYLDNRQDRADRFEARFRITGRTPEIWRADTGKAEPVSYRIEAGQTVVPLDMAPLDSFFVVFRKPARAASAIVPAETWREALRITGGWTVDFQPGRGAPDSAQLPALASLSENPTPGIRYFSGTATYRTTFQAPRRLGRGRMLLDLGRVGDVAEVTVNGKPVGTAWKAPYQVDVTGAVHAGTNRVEVRVADLWVNRLIGDAQPGVTRMTFTTAPTYRPDAPLRPSGLIGPVTLLAAEAGAGTGRADVSGAR